LTYRKVVCSGHILEVYEFERMPVCNLDLYDADDDRYDYVKGEWKSLDWVRELLDSEKVQKSPEDMSNTELLEHFKSEQRRVLSSISRTRTMVRRLALMNFDNGSKFATFTFAENVTDLTVANKEWDKFIKRLRRKYGSFKYLNVVEFQKRGAVHYHMVSDLPYIPKQELAELWGQGFVKINNIAHVDNIGAYIVKYMTKELFDPRFLGRKAYMCSQGLERPIVYRGDEAEMIMQLYQLEQKKVVYTGSYTSEHHGNITYKEFNLKRV